MGSFDINDFLLAGPNPRERFDSDRAKFEFFAQISLSETADAYATTYYNHHGRTAGLFSFDGCYHFSGASKATDKKPAEVFCKRVSNFTLNVDHIQLDNTNKDFPSNCFNIVIKPKKSKQVQCTVTAQELSSPNGLTTMFIQRARVAWEGERVPSLALCRMILESGAAVVRQLASVGHDRESGSYVFQHFMIDSKGRHIQPNRKGFFDISRANSIRPAQHPTIKPAQGIEPAQIWKLIHKAWGDGGATAIAWMVACWWVNQLKEKYGFFPFLSLWGEPQTGKTRLVRILNATQCLDEEGLPMNKVNTGKGEIRKLAQRSGLFKALLETISTDKARFDFEAILPLYNAGNPLQVSALKTTDIQTRETPFLTSLMFVQNKEPFTTRAQKERVISINFSTDSLSDDTASAFGELVKIPLAELSWFFVHVMQQREQIEANMDAAISQAKADLQAAIPDNRLNENHAMVLAFHRLLMPIVGVEHDLKPFIEQIGIKKTRDCSNRAESVADHFFNILLDMKLRVEDDPCVKTDEAEGRLYVNLPLALKHIKDTGHAFNVQLEPLQASLRDHPSFLQSNTRTYFNVTAGQVRRRVWMFDVTKVLSG